MENYNEHRLLVLNDLRNKITRLETTKCNIQSIQRLMKLSNTTLPAICLIQYMLEKDIDATMFSTLLGTQIVYILMKALKIETKLDSKIRTYNEVIQAYSNVEGYKLFNKLCKDNNQFSEEIKIKYYKETRRG